MSKKTNIEIERKFLVDPEKWNRQVKPDGVLIHQGYLSHNDGLTIRIRIAGDLGFLTIKGETTGISRMEYEYPIPVKDAHVLLDQHCKHSLVKIRYTLEACGKQWEVDEFLGYNEGLLMAEIELSSETEVFDLPEWIEKEVSGDDRYNNSSLSKRPFTQW